MPTYSYLLLEGVAEEGDMEERLEALRILDATVASELSATADLIASMSTNELLLADQSRGGAQEPWRVLDNDMQSRVQLWHNQEVLKPLLSSVDQPKRVIKSIL